MGTTGTSIYEVEITTSATDFQTTPGQLNKQVETVSTPVPGEITMIDVATEKSIMEETAPNALLEEGTSRNSTPEEGKTRHEVTTQASSTIVMTHTYVMQERKNGSWNKTDEVSNEITVDTPTDKKDDASSKPATSSLTPKKSFQLKLQRMKFQKMVRPTGQRRASRKLSQKSACRFYIYYRMEPQALQ